MLKELWRTARRRWLGNLIVSNGEAIRELRCESEYLFAGVSDEDIQTEIDRRERRHDELLTKFKEA